ncbi:hypothetical protein [Halobaculum sp. MBLA0143]|uniref:hypothetical protein n=1 Tax=Halobaculum sp. MBLA0143 TaxID=3079933 RepID=UPI003525B6B0
MPDQTESDPEVPVVCDACGTETAVPLSEVETTVTRHNERLHGGETRAEVDPALADQLADLVAEEMGLLED